MTNNTPQTNAQDEFRKSLKRTLVAPRFRKVWELSATSGHLVTEDGQDYIYHKFVGGDKAGRWKLITAAEARQLLKELASNDNQPN